MFAIIKTGGKQYRVKEGDKLRVEKLDTEEDSIKFDDVLYVSNGAGDVEIGAPTVAGASVDAKIVSPVRGPKIIVFKKKRRQNYRRKKGHRQDLTLIEITGITAGGKKKAGESKGDK